MSMSMNVDATGCIGFSRTSGGGFGGILSRAIRMFSAGEWSHVFIVLTKVPFADDYYIIEAGEFGVRVNLLSEYINAPKVDYVLYKPKVSKDQLDAGMKSVLKYNGRAYGYGQFFGFVLLWPYYMITGRRRTNPFGKGIICSELGLIFARDIKINPEVFDKMPLNYTSPEDLNDVCNKEPEEWALLFHKGIKLVARGS